MFFLTYNLNTCPFAAWHDKCYIETAVILYLSEIIIRGDFLSASIYRHRRATSLVRSGTRCPVPVTSCRSDVYVLY